MFAVYTSDLRNLVHPRYEPVVSFGPAAGTYCPPDGFQLTLYMHPLVRRYHPRGFSTRTPFRGFNVAGRSVFHCLN